MVSFSDLKLGFGTSTLFPIGSNLYKRDRSLLTNKPEQVVGLSDNWKSKGKVGLNLLATLSSHERIYVPASNISREPEDGCMKKLKLERSLKLRKEDSRGKSFNVLSNK
jgi:hypothetical protein